MQPVLKKNNENNNESLGRSRGGLSSKIHCIADGLGNPVDFILTGGEVHDNVCAGALLDGKSADFVIADKAYDSIKLSVKLLKWEQLQLFRQNQIEKNNVITTNMIIKIVM